MHRGGVLQSTYRLETPVVLRAVVPAAGATANLQLAPCGCPHESSAHPRANVLATRFGYQAYFLKKAQPSSVALSVEVIAAKSCGPPVLPPDQP